MWKTIFRKSPIFRQIVDNRLTIENVKFTFVIVGIGKFVDILYGRLDLQSLVVSVLCGCTPTLVPLEIGGGIPLVQNFFVKKNSSVVDRTYKMKTIRRGPSKKWSVTVENESTAFSLFVVRKNYLSGSGSRNFDDIIRNLLRQALAVHFWERKSWTCMENSTPLSRTVMTNHLYSWRTCLYIMTQLDFWWESEFSTEKLLGNFTREDKSAGNPERAQNRRGF